MKSLLTVTVKVNSQNEQNLSVESQQVDWVMKRRWEVILKVRDKNRGHAQQHTQQRQTRQTETQWEGKTTGKTMWRGGGRKQPPQGRIILKAAGEKMSDGETIWNSIEIRHSFSTVRYYLSASTCTYMDTILTMDFRWLVHDNISANDLLWFKLNMLAMF